MRVLVFPKDRNPYQELLYKNMPACEVTYLPQPTKSHSLNLALIPFLLLALRLKGYSYFHLHWLYSFRFSIKAYDNVLTQTSMTIYFCFVLFMIKLLGYKLIWTIHNVIPHEKTFILESTTLKLLARACDLKIVHSMQTLTEMHDLGMSTKKTKIIPIGTYTNIYENIIERAEARRKLGIREHSFVFLYFGMIKQYKGVVKLLETFAKLKFQNAVLVIAGQCEEPQLKSNILKYASNPNIKLFLNYIPDNEMQTYLNSADIVVLPFEQITTSSTVQLAFSFGKTVIAPYIGNIKDIPEEFGLFYNGNEQNLEQQMRTALDRKDELSSIGKKANEYVKQLSWENIGNSTEKAYKAL